jgi:hypothetical protein
MGDPLGVELGAGVFQKGFPVGFHRNSAQT